MLRKLMKYDNKAIGRIMLPMYLALVIITFFTFLATKLPLDIVAFNVLFTLSRGIYILIVFVIMIGAQIVLLVHYYRNTICDEAYLKYSLPVTMKQHLVANTITCVMWNFISFFITLLSSAPLIYYYRNSPMVTSIVHDFKKSCSEFGTKYGFSLALLIMVCILFMLVSVIYQQLNFFLCFAAGQTFQGHKLLGCFVVYFVQYVIIQIIATVPLLIIFFINRSMFDTPKSVLFIYGYMAVIEAILSVITFFITTYFFERKLNLE